MRLLFLGDLIGRGGREAVIEKAAFLKRSYHLDGLFVNGENAASGFGITEPIVQDLFDAGIDGITLGNHAFDQKQALVFIERYSALVRPLNFPKGTPGCGTSLIKLDNGQSVLLMNVMGRIFMDAMDDPFKSVDEALLVCPLGHHVDAIILDMHAEASSEKQAMGHFCDGRVSLVLGTHTHVPTSDYHIMEGGTAYISDVGMCGDYNSVIGMKKEEAINRFVTKISKERFTPALKDVTLSGVFVDIDDNTGLAVKIMPFREGGVLSEALAF